MGDEFRRCDNSAVASRAFFATASSSALRGSYFSHHRWLAPGMTNKGGQRWADVTTSAHTSTHAASQAHLVVLTGPPLHQRPAPALAQGAAARETGGFQLQRANEEGVVASTRVSDGYAHECGSRQEVQAGTHVSAERRAAGATAPVC